MGFRFIVFVRRRVETSTLGAELKRRWRVLECMDAVHNNAENVVPTSSSAVYLYHSAKECVTIQMWGSKCGTRACERWNRRRCWVNWQSPLDVNNHCLLVLSLLSNILLHIWKDFLSRSNLTATLNTLRWATDEGEAKYHSPTLDGKLFYCELNTGKIWAQCLFLLAVVKKLYSLGTNTKATMII